MIHDTTQGLYEENAQRSEVRVLRYNLLLPGIYRSYAVTLCHQLIEPVPCDGPYQDEHKMICLSAPIRPSGANFESVPNLDLLVSEFDQQKGSFRFSHVPDDAANMMNITIIFHMIFSFNNLN